MGVERVSSRGNPWHDARGRFCHGPEGGKHWKQTHEDMLESGIVPDTNGSKKSELNPEEYAQRTFKRFTEAPTESQIEYAKKIEKKLGVPAPENGTARDCFEYIRRNEDAYIEASEGQQRKIRHIETATGCNYSSRDRMGGGAGSFIGHVDKATKLMDEGNWEKHDDGCWYCVTHDPKKDGTPGTQNQMYRMRPVREKGHTRYIVERGKTVVAKDENGKKRRVPGSWRPINTDSPRLKAKVSDLKSGMRRAAQNEMKRYQIDRKQESSGRKRKPEGMRESVVSMEKMSSRDAWSGDDNGGFSFSHVYDENNSYEYKISKNEDGTFSASRTVRSVKTDRVYDYKSRGTREERVPHTRSESVSGKFSTPEEAMLACQKHEAGRIVGQRINPKASSKEEIDRWIDEGRIKSKNEYMHLLDRAKEIAKS